MCSTCLNINVKHSKHNTIAPENKCALQIDMWCDPKWVIWQTTFIWVFYWWYWNTQPDSHYIRYTTPSVLKSTTLSTPEGHWLRCACKVMYTTRSPSLPGTTVNTPRWPWMCPPDRQWQGTFDCPLPWCTSMALSCRVLTVGCCSTTVAHYSTTLQPTCSY